MVDEVEEVVIYDLRDQVGLRIAQSLQQSECTFPSYKAVTLIQKRLLPSLEVNILGNI